jgi:hypothetical protein
VTLCLLAQANHGIIGWPSGSPEVTIIFPVLHRTVKQEHGSTTSQVCRASATQEHAGAPTEDQRQGRLKEKWQHSVFDLGKHPTEMVGHEALDPSSKARALWDCSFFLQVPCTTVSRLRTLQTPAAILTSPADINPYWWLSLRRMTAGCIMHLTPSFSLAVALTTQVVLFLQCSVLLNVSSIVCHEDLFGTLWGARPTSQPALSAHALLCARSTPKLARYTLMKLEWL